MVFLIIYSVFGLCLLSLGAKYFVKSSVDIAFFFQIRPYVIALTVIAFGTSMPELVATCIAQLETDTGDIALGNIIGSNIANIGLVLGLSCLIRPTEVLKEYRTRDFFHLFLSSVVLAIFLLKGSISRFDGVVMLFVFILIYSYQFYKHKKVSVKRQLKIKSIGKEFVILAISLLLLLLGAEIFLIQSLQIAQVFHISERLIGLTLVAVGTSIPELAVSLAAAISKKEELSLGNIIGSNLFNTLFVIAIAAFIRPMVFSKAFFHIDLPAMMILTIVLWGLSLFRKYLGRKEGALLLALYGCYLFILFRA